MFPSRSSSGHAARTVSSSYSHPWPRVEILDSTGRPVPGHGIEQSEDIFGDEIERAVRWAGSSDVSALAGRVIRLRMILRDAALFALRFGE